MIRLEPSVLLKGLCVGASMLVPGVSGGSMAMILGLYDRLIGAVSGFFHDAKGNALFLLQFLVGAGLGMVLLAQPLMRLMALYPKVVMYFFVGAVAGSIPMMVRKADVHRFTGWVALYPLLGLGLIWMVSMLPDRLFTPAPGVAGMVMQLVGGAWAAVALVLPGISVSHMLLLMGVYDFVVAAIARLDLVALAPLGTGLALGVVLTTKLLERALRRHPQPSYLMILGFILGSVADVFPGLPSGALETACCCLTLAAGFFALYALSVREGRLQA